MNRFDKEYLVISDRIRDLITRKGVSDQSVSRDLGKSPSYISNIISGRNMPSMKAMFNICDYFDITLKEFFDFSIENPMIDRSVIEK